MKKWTKEEVSLLKENMDRNLVTLKQLLPTKSEDEILEKIRVVYRTTTSNRYTEQELDIVRDNKNTTVIELMKLLPNRSYESISYQKYKMFGYYSNETRKKWTEEEISEVTRLTKEGYTNYEIAEYTGRNIQSVLGLKYSRGTNKIKRKSFDRFTWNSDNEQLIRDTLDKNNPIDNVASLLNLTLTKVYQKALHLGYKPNEILTGSKINRYNKSGIVDKLNNQLSEVRHTLKATKAENKLLKSLIKKGNKK